MYIVSTLLLFFCFFYYTAFRFSLTKYFNFFLVGSFLFSFPTSTVKLFLYSFYLPCVLHVEVNLFFYFLFPLLRLVYQTLLLGLHLSLFSTYHFHAWFHISALVFFFLKHLYISSCFLFKFHVSDAYKTVNLNIVMQMFILDFLKSPILFNIPLTV